MLLPRMVPIGDIGDEMSQGDPIGTLLDDAAQICRQPLRHAAPASMAKLLRHFRLGDHHTTQPQAMLLAHALAQLPTSSIMPMRLPMHCVTYCPMIFPRIGRIFWRY